MLRVERSDHVIVWTIDRPSAKNALDHATLARLRDAVLDAAKDGGVHAGILTGAGDTFVSGGDLRELRGRCAPEDAERLSDAGYALTCALSDVPFPVIAALGGPAIGGGAELAVACDLRIADLRAKIAFKHVRMGVMTAWGTVARLVALVGSGAAGRLLYKGEELAASAAEELGLIDEVTPDGHACQAAMAWAADIARGSPAAIASMKRLVREAAASARDVRSLERELFIDSWTGADHADAVEAYFERRSARWNPR